MEKLYCFGVMSTIGDKREDKRWKSKELEEEEKKEQAEEVKLLRMWGREKQRRGEKKKDMK